MAEDQAELAIRPRGHPRKACRMCRMGKRRCTHAGEGLEESGLVDRTSGLLLSPRNEADETSKQVKRRAPKGANTTNTNAGVDETPSNTTTDPAAPAAPATSCPNTTATTEKSAPKVQKLTLRMPANITTDHPSTAASRARIPDFPEDDALKGSMTLGYHKVYARNLQRHLDEFEVRFKAMLEADGPKPAMSEAWKDVRKSADNIQWTVDQWCEKWAAGN